MVFKMPLLTRENAKEHCRTCLKKLKLAIDDLPENCGDPDDFADHTEICGNIKNLIAPCFEKHAWFGQLEIEVAFKDYPQFVCFCCHTKLQSYEKFRKLVNQSAEKLQALFCDGVHKSDIRKEDEDGNPESLLEAQPDFLPTGNVQSDFKLKVKDTLMETETVMITNVISAESNKVIDPDPFGASPRHLTLEYTVNENTGDTTNGQYADDISPNISSEEQLPFTAIGSKNGSILRIARTEEASESVVNSRKQFDQRNDVATKDEMCITRAQKKTPFATKREGIKNSKKSRELDGLKSKHANHSIDKMVRSNKSTKNNFKCDQCSHRFAHKITLDAHVRKVHEGSKRPFKCDRCEKSYTSMGGLYTHIKEIHEAEVRSYACTVTGCHRLYTSHIAMQKHMRSKHSEVPSMKRYVCEKCGDTFNQLGNLKCHRRSKHPTVTEQAERELLKERFECDICKKLFHSRYTLKYHTLQKHTNETKYECQVCGRRVAKKFMLDQHMLVHSSDKMPCIHCGRQFIRKFELEAHIRAVHMKLKPFECQYCNECFASRKTLRHHEYIHTGEKPYVCDICGQAYRQQTCLKNHRKLHDKGGNMDRRSSPQKAPVSAPAPAIVRCSKISDVGG